jgi:hypothetical protein
MSTLSFFAESMARIIRVEKYTNLSNTYLIGKRAAIAAAEPPS